MNMQPERAIFTEPQRAPGSDAPLERPALREVQLPPGRRMRPSRARALRNRVLVSAGVLICVAIAAAGIWWSQDDAVEVKTIRPSFGNVELSISTSGRVIPVNEFQARASFAGMIEKVYVQLGDTVKPGQPLVKMKDPFAAQRVASAEAALQAAEVSSENIRQSGSQEDRINFSSDRDRAEKEQAAARSALSMFQRLAQSGAVSGAELNAATRRLDAADETLRTSNQRSTERYSAPDRKSWQARVAEARATLTAQKASFDNANISSPIAGTVFLVPVAAYDFVQMGADLLHVADLSQTQIHAFFDEPDMSLLHVGEAVKITWEGRPNASWEGHVLHPPMAAMDRGNRSVGACSITVDDPRHELLPNTTVLVSVLTQRHDHVLTIPREALHPEGPANFVYRVQEGRLHRVPIDVGLVTLATAEVTRGLDPNDVIALHLSGYGNLRDDLKVKAFR